MGGGSILVQKCDSNINEPTPKRFKLRISRIDFIEFIKILIGKFL